MSHIDLLQSTKIFSNCSQQDLASLGNIGSEREYNADEIILSHGAEAHDLMLILSGEIQLELPISIFGEYRSIAFESKRPGDVIGWSSLVAPYKFTLSARVHGGAKVLTFPKIKLLELFDNNKNLAFQIMSNIASIVGQRLHHTQEMWSKELQRSLDERYR